MLYKVLGRHSGLWLRMQATQDLMSSPQGLVKEEIFSKNLDKKKPPNKFEGFRGIVRIRTGVGAFAEPSLAARPRRH